MMNARQQHLLNARTQKRFSTLAKKEGMGNLHNAQKNFKEGNFILARQQYWEAKKDFWWANRRLRISKNQMEKCKVCRK
jgi:hypothetical protein